MKFAVSAFEFTEDPSHDSVIFMLNKPITHKDKILLYLKGKSPDIVLACSAMDYVSKQPVGESLKIFSDSVYSWSNEVVYHFEKYDLELDEEFTQYVLSKMD